MSASAWRRLPRLSVSPPEFSSSAASRLRLALAAALLSLPLFTGLTGGAAAQTAVQCTNANAEGSYSVPADWALKPSGLGNGARFRLLFVTSTTRNAAATGIATYNTFVQTAAKAGHSAISDSCGNLFKVVGSTSSVDARDNAGLTGTGFPIHWLGANKPKVADDYTDFFDGNWDSIAHTDEDGNNHGHLNRLPFTGSNIDGTKHTSYLGRANVRTGFMNSYANDTDGSSPLSAGNRARSTPQSFIAISPVFRVGPPPDTDVCGRTPAVRDAIVAEVSGVSDCADVTSTHLAGITMLAPINQDITSLKVGDFDGLTSMDTLLLGGNDLTTLPAGIFDGLTGLRSLSLTLNSRLAALPAGLFDELTGLTNLNLGNNSLASLLADLFDGLTSLTSLQLRGNPGAPFRPTADAGNDSTVGFGASVILQGAAIGPWGDNVTWLWTQVGGASSNTAVTSGAVTLSGDAADEATFTAPSSATTLHFRLRVTPAPGGSSLVQQFGGYGAHTDWVTVTVSTTPPANNAPTVANAIPDRTATAGTAFRYQFPANTFNDANGDSLTYEAVLSNGNALPLWLRFAQNTPRTFSGMPASGDAGTITVRVTANDNNGGTVTDTFIITIAATPAQDQTVSFNSATYSAAEGNAVTVTLRLSPTRGAATRGARYLHGRHGRQRGLQRLSRQCDRPGRPVLGHLHRPDRRRLRGRGRRDLHRRHRHTANGRPHGQPVQRRGDDPGRRHRRAFAVALGPAPCRGKRNGDIHGAAEQRADEPGYRQPDRRRRYGNGLVLLSDLHILELGRAAAGDGDGRGRPRRDDRYA